jgi:uncharacterized protein YggE
VTDAPAGITVGGHGVAQGTPTLARVRFGAFVGRPRLADSLTETNAVVGRVRAALDEFGIAREDAVTGHLSVQYVQHEGIYHSGHTIDVTLRELSRVGELLTGVLLAGGDGTVLHGVGFDVADHAPLRAEARELAWADAQARAEQLAGHAGRRLGVVTAVTEADAGFRPMAKAEMYAMASDAAGPVDVEPGTVPVAVDLTVTWSFA